MPIHMQNSSPALSGNRAVGLIEDYFHEWPQEAMFDPKDLIYYLAGLLACVAYGFG